MKASRDESGAQMGESSSRSVAAGCPGWGSRCWAAVAAAALSKESGYLAPLLFLALSLLAFLGEQDESSYLIEEIRREGAPYAAVEGALRGFGAYGGEVVVLTMGGADAVLAVKHVDDPHQGAAVYTDGALVTRIIEKPPLGTSSAAP